MSTLGSTASGAASGAAAGAAFGPWGAAIGGVVGGAAGFLKGKKAKSDQDETEAFWEANKYKIPEGVKSQLMSAERQAAGVRLPAEDLRRAQLMETTAGGVGAATAAATSASDVQSMLASLYSGQMSAERDLGIEGAYRYDRNQEQLRKAQNVMGTYEDIEWQQNVLGKYNQRLAQDALADEQRGAEISSISNTIGTFGAGQMEMAGEQRRFDEWMKYRTGGSQMSTYTRDRYNKNLLSKQKGQLPDYFGADYQRQELPLIPENNR